MFGAITYLPQYMQVVRGQSPTESGLQLLPLMAGLLITSAASGILISRWGRYKIFPVAGTAVMTLGMWLLSHLAVDTPALHYTLFMFVLGVGIGGVMQVLVIAVQNVVPYRDLGVATSGATFFRSIGGSFGTAVFGAIFAKPADRQPGALPRRHTRAARVQRRGRCQPGVTGPAAPGGARGVHPRLRRVAAHRLPLGSPDRSGGVRADLVPPGGAAPADRRGARPGPGPGADRDAGGRRFG
jgi:MFS family permease